MQEQFYDVNGIRLHTVEEGDATGKVILFLHGFPEFSYGWRKQLPFFALKGYRAVAVDQRGYNLSSKPNEVTAYHLNHLVKDIKELAEQLSTEKIILVGHDWGGAVAWVFAQRHPEKLQQLIVLNIGHPEAITATLKHSTRQKFKSWYAAFFQIPVLPELLLQAFNFGWLQNTLEKSSIEKTFSEDDFLTYKEAWRQPKALTTMINWYRANKFSLFKAGGIVTVPTLIIWGAKDAFLIKEQAKLSQKQCTNGKLVMLEDATHWIQHEQPEKVNNLILKFIQ